ARSRGGPPAGGPRPRPDPPQSRRRRARRRRARDRGRPWGRRRGRHRRSRSARRRGVATGDPRRAPGRTARLQCGAGDGRAVSHARSGAHPRHAGGQLRRPAPSGPCPRAGDGEQGTGRRGLHVVAVGKRRVGAAPGVCRDQGLRPGGRRRPVGRAAAAGRGCPRRAAPLDAHAGMAVIAARARRGHGAPRDGPGRRRPGSAGGARRRARARAGGDEPPGRRGDPRASAPSGDRADERRDPSSGAELPAREERIAVRPLAILLLCLTAILPARAATRSSGPETLGPRPPLSSSGRWLVDSLGRTVLVHGFNEVAKSPPFHPAAFGFGDDDAAFLPSEGFNALRLGIDFGALMPTPGVIDDAYVEHLAETVDVLARHRIFILLDFHQDGFSPLFNGNGLPDWMAITDGLPNPPDATFPLYYVQNPAMQRAFEHFWANDPGPDGVGLQDHYVAGLVRIAARFAVEPGVVGYDLMNEPWPGATWQPCLTGCPELEQSLIVPFQEKASDAVLAAAPGRLVFVEPFVLFNFGQAPTTLPGTRPGAAPSFHSYALSIAGEEGGVVRLAVEAAERDGAPLIATEFGATLD